MNEETAERIASALERIELNLSLRNEETAPVHPDNALIDALIDIDEAEHVTVSASDAGFIEGVLRKQPYARVHGFTTGQRKWAEDIRERYPL